MEADPLKNHITSNQHEPLDRNNPKDVCWKGDEKSLNFSRSMRTRALRKSQWVVTRSGSWPGSKSLTLSLPTSLGESSRCFFPEKLVASACVFRVMRKIFAPVIYGEETGIEAPATIFVYLRFFRAKN